VRTVGFAVFFRSFRAIALAEFFCASLRIPAIRGLCEKEGPFLLKKKKKTVKNGGSHPVGARAARYIADMLHELLATLQ